MSCTGHDRDYQELVFLHALRALPASELPVLEAHLDACGDCRRGDGVASSHRCCVRLMAHRCAATVHSVVGTSDGANRERDGAAAASARAGARAQTQGGKRPHQASRTKSLRPTQRKIASACWCGLRQGLHIPLTRTLASRSCTCCTESCGSTTRRSMRAATIGPSWVRAITVSGAKPAVRVCSSLL